MGTRGGGMMGTLCWGGLEGGRRGWRGMVGDVGL